ncbi:MAG TPA: hypothetical protein VFI34_12620, partial [Candidatus Limnocylindrales bacterium]|nr:hypothetical protein [Candidatus Limnocylindrales bacterium]
NGFVWISETQPRTARNNEISPPDQPAFNLFVTGETAAQVSITGPDAVRVIALGHFDDPRAAFCVTSPAEACRKSFVVDALLDPSDPDPGPTVNMAPAGDPVAPVARPEEVVAIATLGSHGWPTVLSIVAVRGDGISRVIGPNAEAPEVASARLIWVVRYLDGMEAWPTLQTRLLIDGPAADLPNWVYVVTRDGLRRQVTVVN